MTVILNYFQIPSKHICTCIFNDSGKVNSKVEDKLEIFLDLSVQQPPFIFYYSISENITEAMFVL